MGTAFVFLLVVAATAGLVLMLVVGQYNRLVILRNRFRNAFAQIDVQLKRRHDLIPNLVETAKGALDHEKSTLESVVQARALARDAGVRAASSPGDPAAMKELAAAEAGLTGALGRLFAVAEAYPVLQANQNMLQLTEELTSTENKVSFARQAYNDAVMAYNTACEIFPANLLSGLFGFRAAELFAVTETAERQAPRVSFS
jgi:LemA protein